MATSAPRPIPIRSREPRPSIDSRAQSFPPWDGPEPQPYHPHPPGRGQKTEIKQGSHPNRRSEHDYVPPPSAPPQSLPPPNYGMNYAPPPVQQDVYQNGYEAPHDGSPRSYATTPGAGYAPSQPQPVAGYANAAPPDYNFPPHNQQSQYNPPDKSQYPSSAYAQPPPPPPQQYIPQQQRLHPQDAHAPRDEFGRSPPRQQAPPPTGRPRRDTRPPVDEDPHARYPPHAGPPRREMVPYDDYGDDEGYAPPRPKEHHRRPPRRRSTAPVPDDDEYAPLPPKSPRYRPRRQSVVEHGAPPYYSDIENDYGPRYSDEDEEHERRKQEKRRRRQSTSSKASSVGVDKPSHTFGDSVFWAKDKLSEKLRS